MLVLYGAFTIRAWWICRVGQAPDDEGFPCALAHLTALPWLLLLAPLARGLEQSVLDPLVAAGTLINVLILVLLAARAHRGVRLELPVIPRDANDPTRGSPSTGP